MVNRPGLRALVGGGLALALAVAVPGTSAATPTDDLVRRATVIRDALVENGSTIGALSEQYNGARLRRELALQQISVGETLLGQSMERRSELSTQLRRRAAVLYRSTGHTMPPVPLGRPTATSDRRRVYTQVVARKDQDLVHQLSRVEAQLRARARKLDAFRAEVEKETIVLTVAKSRAVELEARQRALLASAQGQLGAVLRLRLASDDPGAWALQDRIRLLGTAAVPGAPSPGASLAVSFAIAQLGKPYVFAAAGPDTFDCSGLTMMAWRQARVSMAHFAATQYEQFPRVSLDALQPGDLVFFYPTIHHVGIYIGNGMMIHAPRTGDVVRVASINRPSLIGAVRPS